MKLAMRTITGKVFVTLFAMIIMTHCLGAWQQVNASDWVIAAIETGQEAGGQALTIESLNPVDTQLFDTSNMSPGDEMTSTITVENNSLTAFTLKAEVKNLSQVKAGEANLAEQLIINTYRDGVLIPNFPTTAGTYTFPGQVLPRERFVLKVEIKLPGEQTGNEFQNTAARLQWIFTAESGDPGGGGGGGGDGGDRESSSTIGSQNTPLTTIGNTPLPLTELPKTGEAPLWHNVLPGAALVLLGIALLMREKAKIPE